MEDENKVEQDTSTSAEDITSENAETTEETTETTEQSEESVEDLKARLAKAEETAKNQKIRAEKAEKLVKQGKKEEKKETVFSLLDHYALIRQNVPEEDVPEIQDYAKLKGISLSEALKTGFIRTLLSNKAEERATAQATNTRTSARGTGKVTGDSLLSKAMDKGELPESDADMRALAEARIQSKLGKK